MSIADIFNVPSTREELTRWGTLHMIWHRNVIRQIQIGAGIQLSEYIIDPVDFSGKSAFLQNHQTMHGDIDSLTGVLPVNLVDVDWNAENAIEGWFQLHAELTRQESIVLGIFS